MTADSKKGPEYPQFSLSIGKKLAHGVSLFILSFLVVPLGPYFEGFYGTVIFAIFALLLGGLTWFISAGWSFKLELTPSEIRIRDAGRETILPLDKLGMVVRTGRFAYLPTLWLVLRGAEVGRAIPAKGVDADTRAQLEALEKRYPGKRLTYVPIQGMYLNSVPDFVAELKRRIPALTIDPRLGRK